MSRLFGENASGHYVRVDSTPITDWGCTAFGWMRPNNQTDGLNGRALTNLALSTGDNRFWGIGLAESGAVYVVARNTTWYENDTTNLVTGGAWNAVAGTWASATSRYGYLARLTDTSYDTTTGTITSVTAPTTVNRVAIGHLGDSSPNQEANGAIAHVAWWNVVLTAGELEMLLLGRVSPLAVRPQSLVFYTPYLGRDTSEIDIIGGRVLSVSGATASVEEPPILWTPSRKKFFLYSAPVNRSGSAIIESVATITASISANTGKGITIDSATLATCEAEATTADKVDMLISLMTAPVVVKVYNGLGSVMGSGTMESPWAIRSGDSLIVREVVSFAVTTSGTPDDSWYLRFESGSRWVRGSFGLANANRDFSWSLDTWVADQTGTLGTVVLGPSVSSVPQLVGAPTSLSYLTGIGGTHDFSVYGVDPDDDALTYSIVSTIPTGYSMSSVGLLTVEATAPVATNSVTIRVMDATGLYTDYPLTVTVLSASVSATTLRNAGYVLAIDYDVDPTGTEDSWAGLQAAIDYAVLVKKPLYISSGTYLVSQTIRIYTYDPWYAPNLNSQNTRKNHYIQGNSISRPVIKLMPGATNFQDVNTPYPVICQRSFAALNANAVTELWPTDPFGLPADTRDFSGTGFNNRLSFVDIDTNQNPGAVGIHWSTAQDTNLTDVRIVATGSFIGMNGAGGTQGVANIEIEGGQYGWTCRKIRTAEVGSGSCQSGFKVYNQTVACIEVGDFTPITFVGFHFKKPAGGVVVDWPAAYNANMTRNSTPVFIDGVIESPSGIVFDNPGATMYIRNVYVTGSNDLIKSGAQSTVTGTGTWKRIAEYAYTNQSGVAGPFVADQYNLKHWSLINGTKASTPEPATTIENNVAAPSAVTMVAKHTSPLLPRIDNGTYCDVRDYGAVAYNPSNWNGIDWSKLIYQSWYDPYTGMPDARAGINAAIAAAEAAGHNRVFLPRGIWYVSGPIELRAHTQLFGTGTKTSCIAIHHTWAPTTGRPYVVTTPSDVGGTASMNNMQINTIRILGTRDANGIYSGDRFSHVLWRVGRYSFTSGVVTDHQYYDEGQPTQDRQIWTFNGGGGGRHWFLQRDGRGNCNPALRVILADGTTEPLSFYGPSMETGKSRALDATLWAPAANLEVRNARNVRVYNTKREGNAATIWVNSSTNIAHYGAGVQQVTTYGESYFGGRKAFMAVTGASSNILFGVSTVQQALYPATTTDTVREIITGLAESTIVWQEGLSLYKRGTIDDSAMVHTVTATPPVVQAATFIIPTSNVTTTRLFDGASSSGFNGASWVTTGGVTRRPQAGDIIELAAGNHIQRVLRFVNINGSSSSRITIRGPQTGTNRAIIRSSQLEDGYWKVEIRNVSYLNIDGYQPGVGSSASAPYNCGIKVMYATSAVSGNPGSVTGKDGPSQWIKWTGTAQYVTMKHIEVDGGWLLTNSMTTDPNGWGQGYAFEGGGCAGHDNTLAAAAGLWNQDNVKYLYNWIHHTQGEALYIGSNYFDGAAPHRNIEIAYNRVEDCGAGAIHQKCWFEGDNSCHHNIIKRVGQNAPTASRIGITFQCTKSRVYNNWIEDMAGGSTRINTYGGRPDAIQLYPLESGAPFPGEPAQTYYGPYTNFEAEIFNNVIFNGGNATLYQTTNERSHGIACGTGNTAYVPTLLKAYNNTIVSQYGIGIYVTWAGVGSFIRNNVVVANVGGNISTVTNAPQAYNTTGTDTAIFVSVASNNYHLVNPASYPATGTLGVDIANIDYDNETRPQGASSDRGAYED